MTGEQLECRYREWKKEHPQVLALFERFARQMLERGQRFGIKQLAERVRWEVRLGAEKDYLGYRLNNNYPAYIARDLILKCPELAELIETRMVKSEKARAR